jgi:hypothetical protein
VSLAEAETIRRILHLRKRCDNQCIIPNLSAELALRYSPMCEPDAPKAGDGGVIFDASWGWQPSERRVTGGSISTECTQFSKGNKFFSPTGATAYEAAVAHSSFRFFDGDMHFSDPALNVLIRVVRGR